MDKVFKTLTAKDVVDLIPYIKNYLNQFPETQILISCDSQNKKQFTVFGLVIGLYKPGHGAHVLFTRFTKPRIRDNYSRLVQETWNSVELAEYIRENTGIRAKWIDIDINGMDIYDSNKVLRQSMGMCSSMGYGVRYKHKPLEPALLTYAGDKVCR